MFGGREASVKTHFGGIAVKPELLTKKGILVDNILVWSIVYEIIDVDTYHHTSNRIFQTNCRICS